MMLGSCKSCRFYVVTSIVGAPGECRRFPQQVTFFSSGPGGQVGLISGFPQPKPELWCGEFKARFEVVDKVS